MKPIQMVDLQGQYFKIQDEMDHAMKQALLSWGLINGPYVKSFAQNLEKYLNISHVAPCGNGTDALQIALMALGLKPGDEVITVPFTFIATAEVISLLNLKPVFVDIDEDTFNMDVNLLEAAITEKTKCIIPVHLFGQASDMESILAIANKHGIPVVEDNAQSIGADHLEDGKPFAKVGTKGTIGCTSFYPSKTLGAYGDGGALFTNDDELFEKIRVITNHGSKVKYYHEEVGVNSRLDNIQAAVLDTKLNYLDDFIKNRKGAASFYDSRLSGIEQVKIPGRCDHSTHVFHQYTLKVEDRNQLQNELKEKGIPSMVYYPVPLHLQEAYKYCGYSEGDFPISEKVAGQVLSLPMHTELDEEQLNFICDAVSNFYQTVNI